MRATLAPSIPKARWLSAFEPSWAEDSPNCGFMLVDDGRLVGALGAIYSNRIVRGRPIRFCNLSSWTVLPAYRSKGLLLLNTVLKQAGYVFTNLSPAPETMPIYQRLRFRQIDTTRWIVANVPGGGGQAVVNAQELEARLPESARSAYLAHRHLPGVYHLGLEGPDGLAYVVFIRGRYRRLPCAVVVHVADRARLADNMATLRNHALIHHGFAVTAIEHRHLSIRPSFALTSHASMPALYRSSEVDDEDIDGLYSEVVSLTPLGPRSSWG